MTASDYPAVRAHGIHQYVSLSRAIAHVSEPLERLAAERVQDRYDMVRTWVQERLLQETATLSLGPAPGHQPPVSPLIQ
jgi:hypothetical protein